MSEPSRSASSSDAESEAAAAGPSPARKPRRWWHAALVLLVGYALAAVPAFFLLLIASIGFSGCFIECSKPDPVQGWVGVGGIVVVLIAPIVACVAFMKRSRLIWVPVVLLLAGTLLILF
ncbi:hypothetical protein [Arthrobacter sp.]|uniref:hypothetical protein n=1 Tax=Arthrobacter sp. TaxID=1667 RepID=UPI003A8CD5B4